MKHRKFLTIALTAVVAFFWIVPGNVYGEVPKVLQLDGMVSEFSVLEARNAQFGTEPNPPGGGGPAYFVSNGRTSDRRYEFQFVLNEFIDATPYNYLVFEMMGDSYNIINDMNEHYPRFRRDSIYVQFQGSFLLRGLIDNELDGAARKWLTVAIPIAPFNVHANRANHQNIMSNVNIFLLRFILESRDNLPGRIYFRNLRLQQTLD